MSEPRDHLILDTRPNDVFPGLAVWWRPNRCGYTSRLADAGHYTRAEAEAQAERRSTDEAVPLSVAQACSFTAVDADRLRGEMLKQQRAEESLQA